MSKDIPGNQKHITLSERCEIERALTLGSSLKAIGEALHKDPTTIAKEIKRSRSPKPHNTFNEPKNLCQFALTCTRRHVCENHFPQCRTLCRNCRFCNSTCKDFKSRDYSCPKLLKAPFVCNGCEGKNSCRLDKFYYRANIAEARYRTLLIETREGINMTEEERAVLDATVSPLILQGQSPYQVCQNHPELGICEKTLYNYIASNVLSVKNLDLAKKVKYKRRRCHKTEITNREVFKGRTYEDFQEYLKEYPDVPVAEMDTVEGRRGSHKVLLTFFFRQTGIMLAFLRENKTADGVQSVFDDLERKLSRPVFQSTFPLILTDRGGEFSNPDVLERSKDGTPRTRIFFCDPCASWEKGRCEKNHEYIRKILPKGSSFDELTQADIDKVICHINNAPREILNGQTPYRLGKLLLDPKAMRVFGLKKIKPDDVILTPELLQA